MGQKIEDRTNWPDSFHFLDYIKGKELEELVESIEAVRNQYDYNDIVLGIDRIERLCEDNEVSTCSQNVLNILFADEPNNLVENEEKRISISFFPIGVEKSIIIKVAPIAMLVTFLQFVGYERRWRRFVESDSVYEELIRGKRSEILWAITDAIRPQLFSTGSFSVGLYNYTMLALVTTALVIPFLVQMVVFVHGIEQGWAWSGLGLVCLTGVLTGICLVGLLRTSWLAVQPD